MKLKLAALWIVSQAAFLLGWVVLEQSRFAEGRGTSILVRIVPVDPRDLLRGQYMRLSYEFSRLSNFPAGQPDFANGATTWIELRPTGEFYVPSRIFDTKPTNVHADAVVLRGRLDGRSIMYGIEEYYVPEGTPTPLSRDMTVRLRVGTDGEPRIEQVFVKGAAWP